MPSSEPSSPALLAMQKKLSSLETRFDSISSQFSDQAQDMNYGLSVLNTTCDRLKFDLDKTAEVHHQALEGHMAKVATIVSSSEDRTAAALQAFQGSCDQGMGGLLAMMNDLRKDLALKDSAEPLRKDETQKQEPPPPTSQRESEAAIQAIEFANQFLIHGNDSAETSILAQFNIADLDPATYTRHKSKFADVRAFAEAACKDDPSIEADLTAALHKNGAERTSALQTLRGKLGKQSHRAQQLGDLVIIYLLSRLSTATPVRESVSEACRDFLVVGHYDPLMYVERCRKGLSELPLETSTEDRQVETLRGLEVIKSQLYCEVMTTGIIFKLGYSPKPACELKSMLSAFENFKQRNNENAHDYINRFQTLISEITKATTIMKKSDSNPPPGAVRTKLKKGAKTALRHKANHVLQFMEQVSLDEATYPQIKAALIKAEELTAEAADDDDMVKGPPPPSPHPGDKDKEKVQETIEHLKTDQSPALTHALRDQKVCVTNVAHTIGKHSKPCKHGPQTCKYAHKMPVEVGLKNDDYSNFVVVHEHLTSPTATEDIHKIPSSSPPDYNPAGSPASVAAPATLLPGTAAPATGTDQQIAGWTPLGNTDNCPAISAAVLGGFKSATRAAPVPSFMRGAVPLQPTL